MLTRIRAVLEHAGMAPQTVDVLAPVVVAPPPGGIDVTERHGTSEVQLALRAAMVAATFRLDEADEEARARGFAVRGFEADIRRDAERFVGRADALDTLHAALSGTAAGVLWVWGETGIGKSYMLARLVADLLDAPPPHTLVLPYRFKIGDDRCTRDSFLRFAIERLEAWPELPQAAAELAESHRQPRPLETLRALLRRLDGRRVLFVLDSLDEIAERDTRFATEVPLALQEPGVVWLCTGRPEPGLPEVFTPEHAMQPFAHGLPPMNSGDIRTMLLEKIGTRSKQLLKNDQEAGEQIINPFVERVAEAAQGLPLYITYVVGDILSNRFRMLDAGERLPPSLTSYHEELLRRYAVSTLHQVVTPLIATLAAAHEPLSLAALAVVLHRRTLVPDGARGVQLVYAALSALASMVRRALTPEGMEGYTLYHHSLRQHICDSATTRDAVELARQALCQAVLHVGDDADAPYLYRQGITHLLETGRTDDACGLLTIFTYLMARLRTLPESGGVLGLGADWRAFLGKVGAVSEDARLWEVFLREREHILRRGDVYWSAYKILLQLAIEHADDSPATQAAEAWLEQGMCNWVWLRRVPRISHAAPNLCLRVFEGHTGAVRGALELTDGCLLSWAEERTLRLWDQQAGALLAILEGHNGSGKGAMELANGRLLSWAEERTLHLWDSQSGALLATLAGHTDWVGGALELADGHLLSWASDGTLRLWDREAGTLLATLAGHTGWVQGALELADGCLLSWAQDNTMLLWDKQSRTVLKAVSEKDAPRLRADWLAARAESHTPSLVQCGFVGWEEERVAGISPQLPHAGYAALWHADVPATARHLLPDGTFVVTLGSGQVCFLKLYHGDQRINLDALRQLVLPSDAT